MKDRRDRTADIAIGSVNKEWREMSRIAVIIREGRCNPLWAEEQSTRFTGIFKRLLTDPIDELKKQARR